MGPVRSSETNGEVVGFAVFSAPAHLPECVRVLWPSGRVDVLRLEHPDGEPAYLGVGGELGYSVRVYPGDAGIRFSTEVGVYLDRPRTAERDKDWIIVLQIQEAP